jgi:hypothetical protein
MFTSLPKELAYDLSPKIFIKSKKDIEDILTAAFPITKYVEKGFINVRLWHMMGSIFLLSASQKCVV